MHDEFRLESCTRILDNRGRGSFSAAARAALYSAHRRATGRRARGRVGRHAFRAWVHGELTVSGLECSNMYEPWALPIELHWWPQDNRIGRRNVSITASEAIAAFCYHQSWATTKSSWYHFGTSYLNEARDLHRREADIAIHQLRTSASRLNSPQDPRYPHIYAAQAILTHGALRNQRISPGPSPGL